MEEEAEESGEGWIVSFADLMTLLFALFVVLYGLKSDGETIAMLGMVSSIRESFMEIPDDIPTDEKVGPLKDGKFFYPHMKGDTLLEPVIKKYKRASNATHVINEDLNQLKAVLRDIKGLNIQKAKPEQGSVAEVYEDKQGITVKISSLYLYKSGEYRIMRDKMMNLKSLGETLKGINRPLVIEGHTDSLPPRKMSNLELSALRAAHVGKFLTDVVGIHPTKVSVSGYGDAFPIADNAEEAGRVINRRIEIKVKYK